MTAMKNLIVLSIILLFSLKVFGSPIYNLEDNYEDYEGNPGLLSVLCPSTDPLNFGGVAILSQSRSGSHLETLALQNDSWKIVKLKI